MVIITSFKKKNKTAIFESTEFINEKEKTFRVLSLVCVCLYFFAFIEFNYKNSKDNVTIRSHGRTRREYYP